MHRIEALLQKLVPESAINGGIEELQRARSAVAAALALEIVVGLSLVANLAMGMHALARLGLIALFALPLVWVLVRQYRRAGPAAAYLGVMGGLMLLSAMTHDGGLYSPGLIFLVMLPPTMGALGGRTHGVVATVALGVLLGAVWFFEESLAPYIDPGDHRLNGLFMVQNFLTTCGVLLLLLGFRERAASRAEALRQGEREARLVAEAESRSKSQVLAAMSHEIRTPLSGVLGTAELLRGAELSPQDREHVETIVDSGELLLSILNDILDSAKAEAGLLEIVQAPVAPQALSDAVLRLQRAKAEQKGLALIGQVAPTLPAALSGDGQRIQQVLLNLVGNAIKFTASGSVTLRQSLEGEAWILAVEDTGIGISPDRQAAIFDPFVQAEVTTARSYGGTGLGLSISRRLAEQMGGSLELVSTPGVGSRFTLRLPATAVASEPCPAQTCPSLRAPALRVLVAEDNPVNQRVIRMLLERDGHQVLLAQDGREAVALARAEAVDLVLMDLHMPTLDGLQATRALRADPRTRSLPVVGLSASTMAQDRSEALAAGMDGFLSKPVELSALRARLAQTAERLPERLTEAS
ncbi:MAG: ATP-binding protein [Myxococcota bacterium]|nr:ATP-binding protein [Myxococcota bacterium]